MRVPSVQGWVKESLSKRRLPHCERTGALQASRLVGLSLLVGLLLSSCVKDGTRPVSPERPVAELPTSARTPESSAEASTRPAPSPLVVVLVVDQLGSDVLLKSLPMLDPKGAIRTMIERGSYFERGEYPFANTLTAPGHAAIYTGAPPRESGVSVNDLWDKTQQKLIQSVEDRRYPVHGRDDWHVGPRLLQAETVAERLKQSTGGRGKVVSVSLKDRAAVFSVGKEADAALWFDVKNLRFTSSTFYSKGVPAWVTEFERAHPIEQVFGTWQPLMPERYVELLGPDERVSEGGIPGVDASFPHEIDREHPHRLRFAPSMSKRLIAFAQAAAAHYQLGVDDVPDLLLVSVSGTDYAGHMFGPWSWEYADHLVRADTELGALIRHLEANGEIAVVLTSDHGVAPVPETVSGEETGRIYQRAVLGSIEQVLKAEFGEGPWLHAFKGPFLYLTEKADAHTHRAELLNRVVALLKQERSVLDAFTVEEAKTWGSSSDQLKRAAALSIPFGLHAHVMFYTRPGFVIDRGSPAGFGTHHGSPHDYDRFVPVLIMGAAAPKQRVARRVSQLRVAPTIAELLGTTPPKEALEPSLLRQPGN